MLYTAGATKALGRVDVGDTITDHDEEEIARKISISTGLANLEWHDNKINILDTPGFPMFVHEAKAAMMAAESAIVVVDGPAMISWSAALIALVAQPLLEGWASEDGVGARE